MQKDLAEMKFLSRFRPPLRREGMRETLSRSRTSSLREQVPVGFFISASRVLLQCWSCLNGGEYDEVINHHGFLWSVCRSGLVRKEEGRLNCALCAVFEKTVRRLCRGWKRSSVLMGFGWSSTTCQFGNRKFTSHENENLYTKPINV